jgi:serine/threonine protein kinase
MNPEWLHLKKDEILDAIKSCLEIVNASNKLLQGMFNKRYKKIIEIGKGAQGIVYKVQDTQDNNKFKALKKFHQIPIELKESIEWIVAEIELLKNISNQSEYVINYLDTFNQTFMDPDDNEYIIYYVVDNLYEVNLQLL